MLVPAEVWTVARAEEGNAVLIRPVGSDIAVPIIIGQPEAQSIMLGMANHTMPRPMTHDLLLSVVKHLNASVSRIEITELKDGTFYARLILNQAGKDISIDSRSSDCIALAVRIKCPIYIDEHVVDEAGVSVNIITNTAESLRSNQEEELKNLKQLLDQAIEDENYEEAAKLRDRIAELEKDD
ncbi:MAG TPA: bifunctional nuclease family protein [Spirochaetia bacterium]|nr:bifunctional nuclease family protein [Spirochaetia bacterium]